MAINCLNQVRGGSKVAVTVILLVGVVTILALSGCGLRGDGRSSTGSTSEDVHRDILTTNVSRSSQRVYNAWGIATNLVHVVEDRAPRSFAGRPVLKTLSGGEFGRGRTSVKP